MENSSNTVSTKAVDYLETIPDDESVPEAYNDVDISIRVVNMNHCDLYNFPYYDTDKNGVITRMCVHGWIVSKRKQNDMIFVELNDGSTSQNLQATIHRDTEAMKETLETHTFKVGEYMKVYGRVKQCPPDVSQEFEFVVDGLISYGPHLDSKYPISKKTNAEQLRSVAHMRPRTRVFGSVFRIRNTIMRETHNFFQTRDFLLTDPNMITGNECEGGAGVFTVTEIAEKGRTIKDFKKDHFKKQTYLTVSSQLQLEALCCGLGNVYTTNRSFRSEHSSTSKHLSEFTHLEIEMLDVGLESLLKIGENYIRNIIQSVVEQNAEDILFLDRTPYARGIHERMEKLLELTFYTKTYDEIYELLNRLREEGNPGAEQSAASNVPSFKYGEDLSTEIEKFIVDYYGGAVFVTHWPRKIKSFYMRIKRENGLLVENFDLLMPYGVGELIGGSMREENYDLLCESMEMLGVSQKDLGWYLDLRKYGTVRHGGFGLGLERLMMMCTGISNIRDVIPFPNSFESCKY